MNAKPFTPEGWTAIRAAISAHHSVEDVQSAVVALGLAPPAKILDCGCGEGAHVQEWHRRGFDATGVDFTPEFVRHARAAFPGPTFEQAEVCDFLTRCPAGEFDLVTCWFSSIVGHFPTKAGDIKFLQAVRRALRRKGRLTLDLASQGLIRTHPGREITSDPNRPISVRFEFAEPHYCRAFFTVRSPQQAPVERYEGIIRVYCESEVREMMAEAGLECRIMGTWPKHPEDAPPFDDDLPSRLIVIAQRGE